MQKGTFVWYIYLIDGKTETSGSLSNYQMSHRHCSKQNSGLSIVQFLITLTPCLPNISELAKGHIFYIFSRAKTWEKFGVGGVWRMCFASPVTVSHFSIHVGPHTLHTACPSALYTIRAFLVWIITLLRKWKFGFDTLSHSGMRLFGGTSGLILLK